jgi:hypothetical protein
MSLKQGQKWQGRRVTPPQTLQRQRLNSTFIFRCISFSMFSPRAAAHQQKVLWDRNKHKRPPKGCHEHDEGLLFPKIPYMVHFLLNTSRGNLRIGSYRGALIMSKIL